MSRTDTRHNHINIGLRFLAGDGQWQHFEALGWNGVQVDCDAWRSIVNNAMDISSVVMSLEKWSDALGPK